MSFSSVISIFQSLFQQCVRLTNKDTVSDAYDGKQPLLYPHHRSSHPKNRDKTYGRLMLLFRHQTTFEKIRAKPLGGLYGYPKKEKLDGAVYQMSPAVDVYVGDMGLNTYLQDRAM